MRFQKILILCVSIIVLLSACSPAKPMPETMQQGAQEMADSAMPSEAMPEKDGVMQESSATPEDTMMEQEAPSGMPMEKDQDMTEQHSAMEAAMPSSTTLPDMGTVMEAAPAWFAEPLLDVRSDTNFTVGDFKGKVVLVETMAIWCSNCLKQQKQVKALHEQLANQQDFISLGLDIDPYEKSADLKAYTMNNGFDWLYAVATPEVYREIGELYGALFLNPPSTPMLIIDRQGGVHPLPFGIKSADELFQALQPFLKEDM